MKTNENFFRIYYHDKQKFLNCLKQALSNYDFDDIITDLKLIGVGLNFYNQHDINLFIIELEKIFYEIINIKKEKLLNFIREVKIINSLFYECFNSKKMKLIESKIENKSFYPLLLNILFMNNEYIKTFNNMNYESLVNVNNNFHEMRFIEMLTTFYNDYIKYLLFKKMKSSKILLNKNFSFFDLQYEEISYLHIIKSLANSWRVGAIEIIQNNDMYEFQVIEKDLLYFLESSDFNYLQNRMYETASADGIAFETWMNFSEKELANTFCVENLYSIKIEEIAIAEWHRIFSIIIKKLGGRKNKIMFISKRRLMKLFRMNEVSVENAKKILDYLIYNDKSEDFFDAPFFNVYSTTSLLWNFKLAYIPSLVAQIYPCRSLLSIFSKNNFNLQDKGKYFENYFHKYLAKFNVDSLKITSKSEKITYECDLVFIKNNELYLCELKNRSASFSNHKFFENYYYTENDVNQGKRIFDFFSNNLQVIRKKFLEEFNIDIDINNISIHRLIIYNYFRGKNFLINNILVTDIYNIKKYFESKQYSFISLYNYLKRNTFFENTKRNFSLVYNEILFFDKKLKIHNLIRNKLIKKISLKMKRKKQ